MRAHLTLLAASSLALVAFSPRSGPPPDDAATIRGARAEQNAAIAARNLDRVASFWLEDVQVTAGLGFAFRGRDIYRRAFALDSSVTYRREPEAIVVSARWPLAWESGEWTGRLAVAAGPPAISGHYSAQWVKVEGRWLICSERFVALECTGPPCTWPARP